MCLHIAQHGSLKKMATKGTSGKKGRKDKEAADNKLEDREIETVLFVPYTEGSRLQKLIQQADDDFVKGGKSKRLRVVERGGQTLEQMLGRNDPWGGHSCPRNDCLQCQHGGGREETDRERVSSMR